MKPLLETILSTEALKEMAEPTFAVIPTKAVDQGREVDQDSSKLDMGPIGKYENTYNYTYEGTGRARVTRPSRRSRSRRSLNYKDPGEVAGAGRFAVQDQERQAQEQQPRRPGALQHRQGSAGEIDDEARTQGRPPDRDRRARTRP